MNWIPVSCILLALSSCASTSASSNKLEFAALPSDAKDNLRGVSVTGKDFSFQVYRDANDLKAAESVSAELSKVYEILADTFGLAPNEVIWSQVALSRDPNYEPPRHDNLTRWTIPLDKSGALGPSGKDALYVLIPHEQVHAIQNRFGNFPRWYSEGMAEWAGLKATSALQLHLAHKRREALSNARLSVKEPLNLQSWGGISPKPEAVMRQITPEQRARMLSEPGYMPPGPFSFGPGDLVSDESNTLARYAASLEIFETIEAKAGPKQMLSWLNAVAKLPNPKKTDEIVKLANSLAGVDISVAVE